jgi:hypothetical protein
MPNEASALAIAPEPLPGTEAGSAVIPAPAVRVPAGAPRTDVVLTPVEFFIRGPRRKPTEPALWAVRASPPVGHGCARYREFVVLPRLPALAHRPQAGREPGAADPFARHVRGPLPDPHGQNQYQRPRLRPRGAKGCSGRHRPPALGRRRRLVEHLWAERRLGSRECSVRQGAPQLRGVPGG